MKFYTTFFVDPDLADLWEAFPEFTSPSSTFDDLKLALIDTYVPLSRYKLSDLHSLVSTTYNSTIRSFSDLSDYHMRFQMISSDLVASGLLDPIGQTLMYPRGFPSYFWSQISHRLAIKLPDHRTIDPYSISDIYDAAQFVLHLPSSLSALPIFSTSFSSPQYSTLSPSAPLTLAPSYLIPDTSPPPQVLPHFTEPSLFSIPIPNTSDQSNVTPDA